MNKIKLFLITFIVFIVIDGIWLGLIASDFYAQQLSHLMTDDVNWGAAIIFYVLFIIGLLYFVLFPFQKETLLKVFLRGAFFGFITYATYDLTNLATLKDWPILVSVVDLLWGSLLGGATSFISLWAYRKFSS